MNLGPLLAFLSLIGIWAFMEFFPRRPKYHFEDPKKLRVDAKITHILPIAEGSSKQRRIRTSVMFDDGFVYSACIDSRSGLFTISASKEEQLEVANRAIKKHSIIVKKYASECHSVNSLSTLEQETIEYFLPIFEAGVSSQIMMLERLPGNSLVIEKLQEKELQLKLLKNGDKKLLSELTPKFLKYKESEFETWIDYCKSNLDGCEEEIMLREEENSKTDTPEHIIKINNEVISRCRSSIEDTKINLEKLEKGDWELCKYFRELSDSRDA